jgi:hypothetical protein
MARARQASTRRWSSEREQASYFNTERGVLLGDGVVCEIVPGFGQDRWVWIVAKQLLDSRPPAPSPPTSGSVANVVEH